MPTYYNYRQSGIDYAFDDVFIPAELFQSGNLWSWGNNGNNQIGDGTNIPRSTPVTTFAGGVNWKQVSGGQLHAAAIKTDGTLWLWGNSSNGELGINAITNRSTPVTTFAGGNDWRQVYVSAQHTAAIKTDGTLWVWGANSNAQLGINNTQNRSTPVTTFAGGTNWASLSLGSSGSSAIKSDGTLWVWGRNSYGELGINTTGTRSTPVTTFAGGTNWKQVSRSDITFSAIKTDGTLWVWGYGFGGRLGVNDGSNYGISTPVTTFAGGTNWKQVSCAYQFMSAVKTDGTLWVWGANSNAQLGINNAQNRSTPVTTFAGGTNWKQVSCGGDHSVAIKVDGTLWVWGYNISGQLGINNSQNRSTPVTTFAGGINWKQVSCGYNGTYVIKYNTDL